MQGANKTSGVTDKVMVDAFEKYIDSGKTTMDLFAEINDFLDESGFSERKKRRKKRQMGESLDQEVTEEESML